MKCLLVPSQTIGSNIVDSCNTKLEEEAETTTKSKSATKSSTSSNDNQNKDDDNKTRSNKTKKKKKKKKKKTPVSEATNDNNSSNYSNLMLNNNDHSSNDDKPLIIPSQVVKASSSVVPLQQQQSTPTIRKNNNIKTIQSEQTMATTNNLSRRNRRRKRSNNKNKNKKSLSTNNSNNFPLAGNLPDIYWRSIPIEHIRKHPQYIPILKPPSIINDLEYDIRLFRQDTIQWDMLHYGRCTTSQAVAALGLLEPLVAEILNIPPSWRRGGTSAFLRLRQPALRTIDDMNRVFFNIDNNNNNEASSVSSSSSSFTTPLDSYDDDFDIEETKLWSKEVDTGDGQVNNITHSVTYMYQLSDNEIKERKVIAKKFAQNDNYAKTIRMNWGDTQESTALLTALNYFTKHVDPNIRLQEVGMCGAGLDVNQTTTNISSSLLIGATPDGILCYPDGKIEALEVKNHCPFMTRRVGTTKKHHTSNAKFYIKSLPFDVDNNNAIFAHYIPQIQLEMLCVGEQCKSAIMVRQTAIDGALIIRIYRNNKWINEMLYWLHKFHIEYVEKNISPPINFFYNSTNPTIRKRFRQFIQYTKTIQKQNVDIVAHVPNNEIQRMGEYNTPLFLD